uniref:Uncharacterized protein n=1 Tax=Tetraselmis chuii TaxID=63592 RepID=A0A7S1X8K2_9CHLO|mmetsp:Transcript_39481/g.70771  ORF Transcript_39481/g.70771 Transcript_39481/m.70771 type:complete len:416 (+) Transcript_39481:316-1563(+)
MNSMTMTIYPSGDVWFDTEFYNSGYTFAFQWACQWPVADAANTQSVTLKWGGPTETNFVDHESSGKSCVEPGGKDNLCDLYGTLFTIVDGDGGSSGMKATLVKMGEERVGFYSSQPVYLVNQGYPGNNDGPDLDEGWFKVSMGDGLIPAGLRPANAVSCIGTQLNDYAQGADRALAPKENLSTASTYEMPPAMFINIYPDGNVWVEAVNYPSDYELVWEWACQWSIDNTNGASKTLAWAAAPKTGFKDHESGEKRCIDKTGDDACDLEYGVDFIMVDGDGNSTTQAMLVPQGNMRGFYSARPVYAVDVDYPTSNDGIGDAGFTKVMMGGPGILDQGDRPSKPVTCLVSFLSTENQSASLHAPPKDNLYSAGSYDFKHMAVMNIYPDGSIWLELDFSDDDLNFVLEWACLWAVPDS